jgi:ribosomal protein S18 acetylase RimI-like enzyme
MEIEFATQEKDYEYLAQNDWHIPPETTRQKIKQREIIVVRNNSQPVGWLRFGYLWDTIPFMNMLFIAEGERRKRLGTKLVTYWEKEMQQRAHDVIMTSTQSDEQAQHFYRRLGYQDTGALLLPGEVLEIIFRKSL